MAEKPSRKETQTIKNKERLVEAMIKCLGIVTQACKMADLSRETFYRYYRDDSEFAEAIDDVENIVLDYAESKLHKLIDGGDTAATLFLLNFICFFAHSANMLRVKGRHHEKIERVRKGMWREIGDSLSYVARHPGIGPMLVLLTITSEIGRAHV